MKITEEGYKMVHEKYSTAKRAMLLKTMIYEILSERQLLNKDQIDL